MSNGKIFKVEFTLKADNDISIEQIKDALMRKTLHFFVENDEGADVNLETVDFWKTAKVTEIK